MVISLFLFSIFKKLFSVKSTKPIFLGHFSHEKEPVGLQVRVSPSQGASSLGTVEAELVLSEWPEGNQSVTTADSSGGTISIIGCTELSNLTCCQNHIKMETATSENFACVSFHSRTI